MFRFRIFPKRLSIVSAFVRWFVFSSFLLRVALLVWQAKDVSMDAVEIIRTFCVGFVFDVATATFIVLPATIYTVLLPNRWIGSRFDRVFTSLFFALTVFVVVFSFLAEITFWAEFHARFNFIAVDYLIYTHEVIANIRESYPLPLLIGGVLLMTVAVVFLFIKRGIFTMAFQSHLSPGQRLFVFGSVFAIAVAAVGLLQNSDAEWSADRYNSELSKSGIYSFFAAFRNNRMDYHEFYTTIGDDAAFAAVREKLAAPNSRFLAVGSSVKREINESAVAGAQKNVVLIMVESLSASFLETYGNKEHLTPFLDSIARQSVLFDNLYATGTRTVRGMEAVTLSIPPTPGQSIVKRPENRGLFTVADVFASKGYENNFFYGGDGYFDNMNAYFGGNGFTIYDRGRGSVLSDAIKAQRYNIEDDEVTFENAWGICDEDLYRKMVAVADASYAAHRPFFNFVMTTSNHRPYTYPEGKVAIAPGTNRQGAVQYTDYALRQLFSLAERKPWFGNTVFVIIADHCASSAGKDEIDVANYHIPAMIVNLPQHARIGMQCSQLDLFPTLFGLMHWNYQSNFFGKNVLDPGFEPRAFVATYRKLGYLKGDEVMILSDQKKQSFYRWNAKDNVLRQQPLKKDFLRETIAWYQTADYLFANKLLK